MGLGNQATRTARQTARAIHCWAFGPSRCKKWTGHTTPALVHGYQLQLRERRGEKRRSCRREKCFRSDGGQTLKSWLKRRRSPATLQWPSMCKPDDRQRRLVFFSIRCPPQLLHELPCHSEESVCGLLASRARVR